MSSRIGWLKPEFWIFRHTPKLGLVRQIVKREHMKNALGEEEPFG
jgi:hypothetical protein